MLEVDEKLLEDRRRRGIDLVVEIRSCHDETDQKVPWYAALGAGFELTGGTLRITWDGGQAEIT